MLTGRIFDKRLSIPTRWAPFVRADMVVPGKRSVKSYAEMFMSTNRRNNVSIQLYMKLRCLRFPFSAGD